MAKKNQQPQPPKAAERQTKTCLECLTVSEDATALTCAACGGGSWSLVEGSAPPKQEQTPASENGPQEPPQTPEIPPPAETVPQVSSEDGAPSAPGSVILTPAALPIVPEDLEPKQPVEGASASGPETLPEKGGDS